MAGILLITPPFLQPNTPYPATAYLKGILSRHGLEAHQCDLSIELLNRVFSSEFLREVFAAHKDTPNFNIQRIYSLRNQYIATIDPVMDFLRGKDATLATLVCGGDLLPQASRFEAADDVMESFGWLGQQDGAKYLATLYLQDISDYIRATITPHFEIVKYAESISVSVPDFSALEKELGEEPNIIEAEMMRLLDEKMAQHSPSLVCFTIPFPGNLLSSLRCGKHLKKNHPDAKIAFGGGYPTTELRNMTNKRIFEYTDYIILDDGEVALAKIAKGETPLNTHTKGGLSEGKDVITHLERGCPDFSGLHFDRYFSLMEVLNPMHRLWGDGRWNKMMLAHGCYWSKCAFCDTSLDYICKYDPVPAATIVDWMEHVAAQTGSRGFHFVDEAASPKILKDISIEILRRGLRFSWWTNIRFESAFTEDLCRLMSAAGCIAVSGGLEVAADRLLEMIGKGISVESAAVTMRNFFRSGIMVHTYLMYGLPSQTLQETVDALEVVRQMFQAELIDSAFWHRYALTLHSPMGCDTAAYGIKQHGAMNSFANNELAFDEPRSYNIEMVGDALRDSLANYMAGAGLDMPVHKWFAGKAPATTVDRALIADCLIRPDSSRIFDENARLIYIGAGAESLDDGILVRSSQEDKPIKFAEHDAAFLLKIFETCGNLNNKFTLKQAKELYSTFSEEPFLVLYHSKKWDILRKFGLLQV